MVDKKGFVGLAVEEIGEMLMKIELDFRKNLLEIFEEQRVGCSNSAGFVGVPKQVLLLYFGLMTLLMMMFQICAVIYAVYEGVVQKKQYSIQRYAAVYV